MEIEKLLTQVKEYDEELTGKLATYFDDHLKLKKQIDTALSDALKYYIHGDSESLGKVLAEVKGKVNQEDEPKENRELAYAKEKNNAPKTKTGNTVLQELSQNVDEIGNTSKLYSNVTVKMERIAMNDFNRIPGKSETITVKQEPIDKPESTKMLPPKRTTIKRGLKPKIKKEPVRTTNRTTRLAQTDSDVIIVTPKIDTVDLVNENKSEPAKRSTRTKTKKVLAVKSSKRSRSPASNSRSSKVKRAKINPTKESFYEDAVTASGSESEVYHTPKSDMETTKLDNIFKKKPVVRLQQMRKSLLNKYIEKEMKEVQQEEKNDVKEIVEAVVAPLLADIMTDDDSVDEQKQTNVQVKGITPIFDQSSPVKKRVEAFEKLTAKIITETPVQRVTRTKTRNLTKAKLEETHETPVKSNNTTQEVLSTPFLNNFMPSSMSTTRIHKTAPSNLIPAKTLSAIKASQKGFRELEERRRKNEAEAAKKKQEIFEEKKRWREEKEHRNRQQRVQIEKEKILQQKQQEDAEKRRMLAKQKSEERRRHDEVRRAEEDKLKREQEEEERLKREQEEAERLRLEQQKKADEKKMCAPKATPKKAGKKLPVYMIEDAPLLPTYDCYDSDDQNVNVAKPERPDWTRTAAIHVSTRAMQFIDDRIINTMFCPTAQTPDLAEIFENIDPAKLRRNSSAIWKHQPRFTLMPQEPEHF